jgi:hypothetical protein
VVVTVDEARHDEATVQIDHDGVRTPMRSSPLAITREHNSSIVNDDIGHPRLNDIDRVHVRVLEPQAVHDALSQAQLVRATFYSEPMAGRSRYPAVAFRAVTLGCASLLALISCSSGTNSAASPRPVNTLVPELPSVPQPAPGITLAPDESRVLLVGDSTLLAVRRYSAFDALRGFGYVYDAESCRTLGIPSCGDEPKPPNAVEAIDAAEGSFDIVVIMAGYDEWWTSFPSSFDEVVAASRAQGATHIVWLTYREGVGYTAPDGATANEAFVKNNVTLRDNAASGRYPDLVIADWFAYTASPEVESAWLGQDGIHLTRDGAFAVADYVSRTIAHLEGKPCPVPWTAGGVIETPCPAPDQHAPVADIRSLYP